MINRLAILGVGLIGGSLARALRDANAVGEIVGFGRGLANLQLAVEQGVVDRIETSAVRAVQDADVVVLAVPMTGMDGLLREIAPYHGAQTIVTDLGSVKGSVVAAARQSPQEEAMERALRPKLLQEYVGQAKAREQLEIFIGAARKRADLPVDRYAADRERDLERADVTAIGAETVGDLAG